MPSEQVAIISYDKLIDKVQSLNNTIEQSYGSNGLGILFIRGIPKFVQMRKKLLLLTDKLGKLPKDVLALCQRALIYWTRGWSHGREKFNGKPDFSKGSYYFKAVTNKAYKCPPEYQDIFTQDDKLLFSQMFGCLIILHNQTAMEFSKLLIEVGALLAQKIDQYLVWKVKNYTPKTLTNIIKTGEFHVGRLLHYFPFDKKQVNQLIEEEKGDDFADWCGWHNDHGALTALTSALYTDQNGQQITFPLKTGGLYAKGRNAKAIRIKIPSDCLAFQIGQSMQILSGGHLQATPHAVVKSKELGGQNISRNTFALFMQPDPLVPMKVPQGQDPKNVFENKAFKVPPIQQRWQNGKYFKDFHHDTILKYINSSM